MQVCYYCAQLFLFLPFFFLLAYPRRVLMMHVQCHMATITLAGESASLPTLSCPCALAVAQPSIRRRAARAVEAMTLASCGSYPLLTLEKHSMEPCCRALCVKGSSRARI